MSIGDDLVPGTPLRPGVRIAGRYELGARLGGGGMGEVYRARDLHLQRDVAIKRLLPHLVHRQDLVQRSEREGQILASLRHPAIIDVYDMLDSPDGGKFLVLELVPGRSLADELRLVGCLPWNRCADVGIQVCGALAAAHRASVIHRDVKPANILVSDDGSIHVADFGIARLSGSPAATADGAMIGTPGYWAPEQGQAGEITPSSDLYSLCCVLFEAACGRTPYVADPGASPATVFVMHIVQPVPDPHDFVPDLPEKARVLLVRGLAKDPSHRFESAEALAAALAESREPGGTPALRMPLPARAASIRDAETVTGSDDAPSLGRLRPSRRRVALIAGVAAAVLAGIGVGAVSASSQGDSPSVVETKEVSAGHIRATVPEDWTSRPATPARSRPFELRNALDLRPPTEGARRAVIVGTSTATGPSLLPAGLAPEQRSVVRMGELVGFRYPGVRAGGRPVDAYVAPASDGVTTVLCPAATGGDVAEERACSGIVSSLRLIGASAFPLGPDAVQARALGRALGRADSSLARGSAITEAATAPAQAAAATSVAVGLRQSIGALPTSAESSPVLRPALGELRRALTTLATGYESLSGAAAATSASRWDAARAEVERGAARLDAAQSKLGAAGYSAR